MSTTSLEINSSNEDLIYKVTNEIDNNYVNVKRIYIERQLSYSNCDFFDYIPIISNVSGIVRVIFGGLEALVGIPLLPLQLVNRVIFTPTKQDYPSFYLNKGISNIVRGSIAQSPIVGNIALYIYDHSPNLKHDIQNSCGIHN